MQFNTQHLIKYDAKYVNIFTHKYTYKSLVYEKASFYSRTVILEFRVKINSNKDVILAFIHLICILSKLSIPALVI